MANTGPTAGTYYIVSAGSAPSTPFCAEVANGSMSSGANVRIWRKAYAATQYWKLSYDKNGVARLVNLASGKSLDVYAGRMQNQTNVRVFNDNGTNAQRWDIVPDGGEGYCDGHYYITYKILSHANNNFALDVDGNTLANKKNIQIYSSYNKDLQSWMFVPMPTFSSGGTYEIRSMLKTSMCVDVAGGSNANGANVQLWSHNGANSQKFYITEESSGQWSIMSVSSDKYIDVKGGGTAVGTNVQQYSDNDSRSQRWKVTEYGTTVIDGKECTVVTFGSYVTGGGDTRFMDVRNALTTNSANVQLGAYEVGTDYSQRFALYPTSPKSDDLVVPANLGWVEELGSTNRAVTLNEAEVLYPSWTTATSWPTDSANGYQWRYRKHSMSAETGAWGAWTNWIAWEPVAVRVESKNVWAADGLPATVDSGYTQMQYELQVRAVSYEGSSDGESEEERTEGEMKVGEFAAATLTAIQVVNVELGYELGFGPEGLRIPYTSEYSGTVSLIVENIQEGHGSGGAELLKESVSFDSVDSNGSVLIPVSKFVRWLEDEENVRVTYSTCGDDGIIDSYISVWDPHVISYNTGKGLTVTPTISVGKGRAFTVRVVNANVSRAWLRRNGTLAEMKVKNQIAQIYYPFGEDLQWEVFVAAHSTEGDRWGVAFFNQEEFKALMTGYRPCHAFNWDGGSFLLEVRQSEYLETDYTIENDAQAYKLNKRAWDTYRFGDTKSGKFKAVGAIYDFLDLESTKKDLEALIDARHVLYRSPHGDMCDVAVLGASMTCNRDIWTVTIDMARETV